MLPLLPLLLPFYTIRFTIWGLPTTLLEACIVVMVLAEGIRAFRSRAWTSYINALKALPRLWRSALALFILASLIALLPVASLWKSLGLWRAYILEPLIVFAIALVALQRPRAIERLLLSSAVAVLIVSIVAIAQWFIPNGVLVFGTRLWAIADPIWSNPLTHRSTSVFGYPNAIGLFVAPFLPLLLYGLWRSQQKKVHGAGSGRDGRREDVYSRSAHPQQDQRAPSGPWWYIISIGAGLIAIVLARSHGALVAIAVATMLAAILTQPKERILKGTIAIALLLIMLAPFSGSWLEGFSFQKPSGQLRLGQWQETLIMLTDRPLIGAGFGNYQNAILPYHNPKLGDPFLFPHTMLLNMWSEMGLLGVIAWTLLLWSIFKMLLAPSNHADCNTTTYRHSELGSESSTTVSGQRLKILKQVQDDKRILSLSLSFLIILIHGLVDVPYFKNDLAVQFWLLTAMAATTVDKQQDTGVG